MNHPTLAFPGQREGFFGPFGGQFVPETMMRALNQLAQEYAQVKADSSFWEELHRLYRDYVGRPTPLYFARRLTEHLGGAKIYLKREDLAHTGAHKINNTLGQILLARRIGKRRIIAETGAGQHGVATATAAALFGLECVIYMGAVDMERQALNVFRMELLGAKVVPVETGSRTLKDAINEAFRDWIENIETTHYIFGSVCGPHPYPTIVRDFQSVIGREAREQILEAEGRLPDYILACVGGGSNAMGIFYPFLGEGPRLIGVEAGGLGLESGRHAATLTRGSVGIFHGARSYVLQDEHGLIQEAHSISAGLDYPGVGPEHSYLKEQGLAQYVTATDEEALEAFLLLSRLEGILPALEPAHALAYACRLAPTLPREAVILVNLSGRGDKDVDIVRRALAQRAKRRE